MPLSLLDFPAFGLDPSQLYVFSFSLGFQITPKSVLDVILLQSSSRLDRSIEVIGSLWIHSVLLCISYPLVSHL